MLKLITLTLTFFLLITFGGSVNAQVHAAGESAQTDKYNVTSFFAGVLWSDKDPEPIVVPLFFATNDECEKILATVNSTTGQTIGVIRRHKCHEVLMNTEKFRSTLKSHAK